MKNLDRGFEVKNFSYSLFKGNYCMESKVIEYGIKVEHSPDIIHFFTHKLKEHFVR